MSDPWKTYKAKPGANPLEAAAANLQAIDKYIRHLKKLAEDFGTEEDTQELRDRMHEGRNKTNELCKGTTNLLKTPASDKATQDKLKRQLQGYLGEFQRMSQEQMQQEREILVQMEQQYEQSYSHKPDLNGGYDDDEDGGGGGRGRGQTRLKLELADGMEDADVKIIQERNRDVQKLDEELGAVVELFQEVNEMVVEQGEKLDRADETIKMSEQTVKDTQEELSTFYRCCWCCCVKKKKR